MATQQHDPARTLARQVGADFGAALSVALAYIGDQLGIFKALADSGPMTTPQLAITTGLNERYLREWAAAMAASNYIDYDAATQTFTLSPAQRTVLLDTHSVYNLAGAFQYAVTCFRQLPGLATAFREGGGIPFADFGPEISEAIRRMFQAGYETWVAAQWLPAVPEINRRLRDRGAAAELGCGGGQCLIPVAKAFPNSHFTGYDVDPGSIAHARDRAQHEGVAARVSFELRPAEQMGVADRFDLVMAFNCIHDMANPRGALRAAREAIKPDGVMLWSEAKAADRLEDNLNPWGRAMYGASTMHCMTVSLAHHGEGLGSVIGPKLARELAREAGFVSCEPLGVDNQVHQVFVLRK